MNQAIKEAHREYNKINKKTYQWADLEILNFKNLPIEIRLRVGFVNSRGERESAVQLVDYTEYNGRVYRNTITTG